MVGNGTYGQVYKVGVGRLLCFLWHVETSGRRTRRVINTLLTGGHATWPKLGKGFLRAGPLVFKQFISRLALEDLISWL